MRSGEIPRWRGRVQPFSRRKRETTKTGDMAEKNKGHKNSKRKKLRSRIKRETLPTVKKKRRKSQ